MKHSELVRKVAKDNGYSMEVANEVTNAVISAIQDALLTGHWVRLKGVGDFTFIRREERLIHNVIGKGDYVAPPSMLVKFTPAHAIRYGCKDLQPDQLERPLTTESNDED